MSSRNNRTAGHGWELMSIKILRPIFPKAVSSRAESRNRDAAKVDICHTGFLNVQCKNYSKPIKYDEVLDEMPNEKGQMNVIFDRQTRKHPTSGRFMKKGEYVHMHLEDFITLISKTHETDNNTTAVTFDTFGK
jgi:hypothetical protein